jgi:Xaa-Pro aminopeptidase
MIADLIARLRDLMKKQKIQAYIIPSTDPHQSEYVPALWERRSFISGFTGSAGDVVVTDETAGLWTDSRYFLQAAEELDAAVYTLFKVGMPGVPSYAEWLAANIRAGGKVGVDARLLSHKAYGSLAATLAKEDIALVAVDDNLADRLWTDRPAAPDGPVLPLPLSCTGESLQSKLSRLREKMTTEKADAHVITTLDAIAWLFNSRGSDVEYNPVVISYAIVSSQSATLYVDPAKITDDLVAHIGGEATLEPYDAFEAGLAALKKKGGRVWIDPDTCSRWIVERLGEKKNLFFGASPITLFKALKNPTEIEGSRAAHVHDGVALVRFLKWLEEAVPQGGVTEMTVADKLIAFRSMSDRFRGASFATIAGYGAHGAVIHYEASPESDVPIENSGILLVDSGGQYLDGTTDVTRTLAMGEPTAEQKDRFTRVLKGTIRTTIQPFPQGTAGRQIDSLARMALWNEGLNFLHGVGHGVGSYLNVHEGPQAISYYRCTGVALEPGMIQSIEPGYYKDGEYGIRIENLTVVCDAPDLGPEGISFRRFETLTLCPVDTRLIEKSLLDSEETAWLNDYHGEVRETLSPLLEAEEREWLEAATKPI